MCRFLVLNLCAIFVADKTKKHRGNTFHAKFAQLRDENKNTVGCLKETVVVTSDFVAINIAKDAASEPNWCIYDVEKLRNNGLKAGQCLSSACSAWKMPDNFARCSCPGGDHKTPNSAAHRDMDDFHAKFRKDSSLRKSLEVSATSKATILATLKKHNGVWPLQDF